MQIHVYHTQKSYCLFKIIDLQTYILPDLLVTKPCYWQHLCLSPFPPLPSILLWMCLVHRWQTSDSCENGGSPLAEACTLHGFKNQFETTISRWCSRTADLSILLVFCYIANGEMSVYHRILMKDKVERLCSVPCLYFALYCIIPWATIQITTKYWL